jgi:uncharacterized protein (TIGR03066 family)
MNVLRLIFAGYLVAGLIGLGALASVSTPQAAAQGPTPAAKAEAPDKEKLIGKWEVVKSDDAPLGSILEITKDGKLTFKVAGKDQMIEGTYVVDGDKLLLTQKRPGGKERKDTFTITKLTDTDLWLKEEGRKRADEYKKK